MSMNKSLIIKMLSYAFIILAACFLFLRYFELHTLFVPYGPITDTPESVQLVYQDVALKTRDGVTLRAWYVPHSLPNLGTIYFFHGNGGNISHRVHKILFFHEMGYNVFIIDYRGYGQSAGQPTERGLYLDAQAGYDYLNSRRDRMLPLVVFGESLGGSVAVDLATKRKVDALILEGTFSSIADISQQLIPLIPTWALVFKFDSLRKIRHLDVPVFIMNSRNDEVVPYILGKKLFEASPAKHKEFMPMTGGHNVAFFTNQDKLRQNLDAFLAQLQKS